MLLELFLRWGAVWLACLKREKDTHRRIRGLAVQGSGTKSNSEKHRIGRISADDQDEEG